MRKSLGDLVWNVTEPEYRANQAISYSTLSTFAREGASVIPNIHQKKEAEALRFGGLLDTLITEPEVLEDRYFIGEYPKMSENVLKIVKKLYKLFYTNYKTLSEIPENQLLQIINEEGHGKGWKDETKVKDIITKGSEYYTLLAISEQRTIVSNDDYARAQSCVTVLKTHPYTTNIFNADKLAFFGDVEVIYQPKFILEEEGIRCMFDIIIVDHEAKTIRPMDLKSTSGDEDSFPLSFKKWRYDIQSNMYSYILKTIVERDEYFKDFTILPFTFIYISKFIQKPILWVDQNYLKEGKRVDKYGTIYKDWRQLLKEFKWHKETGLFDYSIEVYENGGWMDVDSLSVLQEL